MPVHHLLREAVLLTLIKGDDRMDRTAMIVALGQLISVTDIDSLGNLGNFSEWYVIFNSTNARQNVLKNDELKVGDQVFMISEPYKHVKIIRLTNVPPSVSDEDIRSIASNWGGSVLGIDSERLPRPYEAIKTFIRRIRIRFSSQQDEEKVPVTIRFSGFTFSVHLEGRGKVCYRCKGVGHIKATCTVMKCQKCYQLGHDDPNCQQRRSYATAVVSTPIHVDLIPSPVVQESPAGNLTSTERTTNPLLLPQPKLPFCRKCKQLGHKRKNCPRQESPLNQLNEHGENNHANSIEGSQLNQLNEHGENNHANSIDEITLNQLNEQGVDNHANSIEDTSRETPSTPIVVPEKEIIVTAFANGLQHQIMYEAYKNPNNDFKRTCADRSIDSDFDTDPKKPHTHDSFTSMLGDNENEEGEVIER